MRLLLDTHVVLWAATQPARLEAAVRARLEDTSNEVLVSVVSAWDIAIKQSLGKLDLVRPAEVWLPEVVRRTGFEVAPIDLTSALRVRALPWHHRDPFDRLLVAQALELGCTLVSRDDSLARYGVPVLRA